MPGLAATKGEPMATTTSEEFEKATDYQFKEEDIERAKSLVGRWAPSGGGNS